MKIKLVDEDQLLDPMFRQKVISEIKGRENVDRKLVAEKRHDCYRDNTRKWVIENMVKEFNQETVEEMLGRVSNISIARKIVDKLARSYNGGVEREVKDEKSQESIDALAREMDFDSKMKKWDRYVELFKNTELQVVPEIVTRESEGEDKKFKLKVRPLPPQNYDVLQDPVDAEKHKCVILSEFVERAEANGRRDIKSTEDGRDTRSDGILPRLGINDNRDQTIANSPEDKGQSSLRTFIFWSDKYHFTTDEEGEIISEFSPEDLMNPIQKLPFVNLSEDQDGSFYARGGEDLIDGAILINTVITDMFSIANVQGWGQLVLTGKNLPKNLTGGPHKALILEQNDSDDPAPDVKYVSSNPPLDVWMRMVEQYTALLLSSKNLSPTNIAAKLDAQLFPSGIAMLIEQSESTASLEDRQKLFKDAEPEVWEIVKLWHNYLKEKGSLSKDFDEIDFFEDADVRLKFMQVKPVTTEKERLEMLKIRKELGLNTMIEIIKMDNPELDDEMAEEKLKEILEEKIKRAETFMPKMIPGGKSDEKDPGSESQDEAEEQAQETEEMQVNESGGQ